MHRSIIAFGLATLFFLSIVTVGSADTRSRTKKAPVNSLAALLPASDAVVTFDSDRFFAETLPQILVSNPELYRDITGKIDQIQKNSGMDIRQLEQLAVGLTVRQVSKGQVDYDPLMLARGKFNSDVLVAIVALVSSGKSRQETIAGRTVYIFQPSKVDPSSVPNAGSNVLSQVIDMLLVGIDREMALTAYDSNTLAVGATERVRDLLEKKSTVSDEMLASVNSNSKAVIGISAKMPTGLNQFIELGDDALGKTLGGVRFLNASMDVAQGDATIAMSARMDTLDQATNMKDMLIGFQALFGGMLAGGKGKDKEVLARTLKNIRVNRTGAQVSMAVTVPQSDIALLVGAK